MLSGRAGYVWKAYSERVSFIERGCRRKQYLANLFEKGNSMSILVYTTNQVWEKQ